MSSSPGSDSRFVSLTLLGSACFILFLLGLRTISSADIWLHMAAGRHALEHGPASIDPFSFSLPVKTVWLQTTWLYDILIHLIWGAAGSGIVTILHAAAVTLAFILLIPVARRYGNDVQIAAAILLCAWMMAPLYTIRPAILTPLFIAVFVRFTARPSLRRVDMVLLVVFQVLWVNMAPWFMLGPMIMAIRAIEARRAGQPAPDPVLRPAAYAGMALALLAATTVNPFGIRPAIEVLHTLTRLEAGITLEWISPFARDFLPYPLTLLPTLSLVMIAGVFILYRNKLPMVLTTLAVIATFQMVQSSHHLDVNAVMVFPFTVISAACICRLAQNTLSAKRSSLLAGLATTAITIAMAVSVGMIITNRYYIASGSASAFGWGMNTDAFPVAVANNLEKMKNKPSRLVNLSHDGGYLLWRLPGIKVFTDSRGELYGTDFFDMLSRGLVGHEESWKQLIERYDPDALLIHGTWTGAGATANRLLQGDQWAMAYFDGTSMLLVRTISSNAELLDDTKGRQRGLELIEKSRERYATYLHNRFVRPPNPSRLIGAASVFQALGRVEAALPLHTLLTEGSPRYVGAWINRGIAEIQAELGDAAIVSMEKVVHMIPANPIGWLWLGKAYESVNRISDANKSYDQARAINRLIAERFLSENATNRSSTAP